MEGNLCCMIRVLYWWYCLNMGCCHETRIAMGHMFGCGGPNLGNMLAAP